MLNLDEFTQIMIHCILYLNAGRTLNDAVTLAQKWLDSDISLLNDPSEELLLMSLPREAAKLTRKGLRINGLLYVPTDMDGLTLDKTYDAAFFRSDLSCVYVLLDDCSFKPCWLSPHQSQYSGLSQPEASTLKQHERKQRSKARKREVAASVESIQSIRQIVRDASAAGSEKPKQDGKVINENRSGERRLLTWGRIPLRSLKCHSWKGNCDNVKTCQERIPEGRRDKWLRNSPFQRYPVSTASTDWL